MFYPATDFLITHLSTFIFNVVGFPLPPPVMLPPGCLPGKIKESGLIDAIICGVIFSPEYCQVANS